MQLPFRDNHKLRKKFTSNQTEDKNELFSLKRGIARLANELLGF